MHSADPNPPSPNASAAARPHPIAPHANVNADPGSAPALSVTPTTREQIIANRLPRFLGLETTCDETAAAVFDLDANVLSNVVSSQIALHERFGGVVPEIAARAHSRQLLPVLQTALVQSDTRLEELAAVAVAYTPGLVGAILIGLAAAKTLAATLEIPLLGVNHLEGHIYACQMYARQAGLAETVYPCVGFVVSGGHTNLFHCTAPGSFNLIGSTIDDAAGEAFDKVASMLELGYPGGPAIEQAARGGNPKAYRFPRTFIHEDHLDFSFSGLKTSVLYQLHGQNARKPVRELTPAEVADVCASFQQAVIEVLVQKCERACQQMGVPRLCVGGGVAANTALRMALADMAQRRGLQLFIPPLSLCTDNAAMAAVAIEKYRTGQFDPLDLDAVPGLVRRRSS